MPDEIINRREGRNPVRRWGFLSKKAYDSLTFLLEFFLGMRLSTYFAAPLLTESERDWIRSAIGKTESFAVRHGAKVEIIFPYELITQSEIDRLGEQAKLEIFSRCKSHLDDTDILIALLDGPQVDDGTSWEIGYFYARKSPEQKIIGIRTDFRRAGESDGADSECDDRVLV
jgi:nucleoside 2-deoxyribosyltransferase